MARFMLESLIEIWDDDSGSRLEIGPDRDGLGLLEIREKDASNKILARITLTKDQAELVRRGLGKLLDDPCDR